MWRLKSISEHKVLSLALGCLMDEYRKEARRIEECPPGRRVPVAEHRAAKLGIQIAEIERALMRIEKSKGRE
jgi:hypothetical protein